jgi:hypothetical protein
VLQPRPFLASPDKKPQALKFSAVEGKEFIHRYNNS